jgi:type I restriction enzyme S subunit
MSEWKVLTAEDFCDSVRDGTHDTPKQVECGYKLVTAKHISNGQIDLSDAYLISESDYLKINERSKVERWDVLMSMIGNGLGKSAVVKDNPQYAIKNLALFKIGDETRAKWLHYYLSSNKGQGFIYNSLQGSGQPFISLSLLRKFPIPVPDDEKIMRKVVATLSRYDSLIENYQKQIKLLEEAAQRLYKEWFVDLHFPGHENTKIVDGVPEGWEKNTINDVCTLITSGSTPSRNKNSYWENGTIRWVKTKELLDSWILDTEEYITQEGYNNSSTKLFPANTILMAIYASPTLGRLGILSAECCCNQAALGLIADEKVISWQWLFWKLYELRDEFNAIARGAGQQNISGIVVKNKEIVIPAKRVIDGFTSVVSTMFEQQKNLQSQIRLLTEARDRLLPKLMGGEIAV